MTRAHRSLLSLTLLVFFSQISLAQVQTGIPPFGTFAGGPETINLANLNSHVTVPVRQRSGRGMDFSYSLSYDSLVWYPVGVSGSQNWQPATNWGWKGQTQTVLGYISYGFTNTTRCLMDVFPRQYGNTTWYKNWVYVDEFGSAHGFGLFSVYDSDCYGTSSGSATATDGSGYTINATGNPSATVTPRGGGTINAPLQSPTGSGSKKDSNGNLISVSAGSPQTFTDTLGTTALTINGSAPSPVSYTYKNAAGTSVSVTIYYQAYTVKTNFGVSGISEYGPTNVSLVDHITLPNGKQYGFTYEQTPGTCTPLTGTFQAHCVTARIASVTLPTGGQITYAYSGGSNGIFSDGTTATLTRTTPDGQWTYARTQGTAPASTTTITDPQNNQTVIQFQGIYETERQAYQGSAQTGTRLQTVNTCYNGSAIPCTATAVTLPITQRTAVVQLDSAGPQSKTDLFLNSFGLPTKTEEYDYGTGSPGPLVRKTLITYASLGNGIVDRPATITVCTASGTSSSCGGTGTQVAQTTISYDETAVTTTTGVPQRVAVTGSRGNPTTVKQWISGATYATSTMTYYDTGNVRIATDPGLHQTTVSYSDSWGDAACPPTANTQAYPTQITNTLSQNTQIRYFQCTAQPYSVKDPNDIANVRNGAVFTYADSLSRLTRIDFADAGQTTVGYDDTARTVTTTQKQTATVSVSETDQFDQLGRLTQRQVPGGRKVDTLYDSLGRVWKQSNPYINTTDSTYGLTETQYDALGRVIQLTRPDGSFTQTFYGAAITAAVGGNTAQLCTSATYGLAYPTFVKDEAQKKREMWVDAFGRTIEVDEPDSASNLTLKTCYKYDLLDNLLQVDQGAEQRTYSYDALSRPTLVTTPESGGTNLYYTTSLGGLCSGDPNAICRRVNARGITTTYNYDALNRLTKKEYSNADPTVQYFYDQTAYNGLTITNGNGRRTGMSDASGTTAWSYDATGQVLAEQRTIAGITKNFTYAYQLDGSPASITYPSGRVVTYSYDAVGRPVSAIDTANSINYVTQAEYAPHGKLSSLKNGATATFAGITTTNSYNNRLQPSTLSAAAPAQTIFNLGYNYALPGANNENPLSIENRLSAGRTQTFTYDVMNRVATALTQATAGPDCWGQNFGYDRYNNLLTVGVAQCSAPALSVEVNANNQITNVGFSYNATGDLMGDGSFTYSWDAEDRLTSAAGVTYTYDGDGLRVKKSNGKLYWRGGTFNVLAESNLTGTITKEFIFFAGRRTAVRDALSGAVHYFFLDHLGSVRVIADANGAMCYEADFLPFGGELLKTNACPESYKFATYERDPETGLDYAIFRYYSPNLGRFVSPDPLAGEVVDPQSLNRYEYVRNNPPRFRDPLGLCIKRNGGGGESGGDGDTQSSNPEPKPPGLPGFSQAAYTQCVNQAFGSTSGAVPGVPNAAIPTYDLALTTFQAGLLVGADLATLGATLALERPTTNLDPRNLGEPNGTVSYGPANINSANFNASWIVPGTFGTNLAAGARFNGDPQSNIASGGRLLNRLGNHPERYVGRGPLAQRRARDLANLISAFRDFFNCLSQNAVPR